MTDKGVMDIDLAGVPALTLHNPWGPPGRPPRQGHREPHLDTRAGGPPGDQPNADLQVLLAAARIVNGDPNDQGMT